MMRTTSAALVVLAFVVTACSSSDTDGDGSGAGGQAPSGGSGGAQAEGGSQAQGGAGGVSDAAAEAATTSVPGFGEVSGECAACLDTSINGDGVCAAKYSACLADVGCGKLLKCYRECAKLTGDEYGACVSTVAGCAAGATDAQKTLAFQALDCACCDIGACRMECKQQCAPLDNSVYGPFACGF